MKKILAITMIVMAMFAFGCGRNAQFGVVDLQKVQTESEVFKNATKELQEKGKAMEEDLKKQTEGKSDEEAKKIYTEMSAKIRTFQAEEQNKVKTSFEAAAAEVAKQKNLSAILAKEAVPQGGIDVTDDIIKAMK
jgi:outer membrane protein